MAKLEDLPEGPTANSSEPATSSIPLHHPSTLLNQTTAPLISQPELELRSGTESEPDPDPEPDPTEKFWDEFFDALILTIPMVFLYLLLDILVHLQYQHRPTIPLLVKHLATATPTLGIIVFYTTRYITHPINLVILMLASAGSGTRLIWLINKASWSVVTAQAPAVGTIWLLTIIQLPLSIAVVSLAAVAGWVRYAEMKITP